MAKIKVKATFEDQFSGATHTAVYERTEAQYNEMAKKIGRIRRVLENGIAWHWEIIKVERLPTLNPADQ